MTGIIARVRGKKLIAFSEFIETEPTPEENHGFCTITSWIRKDHRALCDSHCLSAFPCHRPSLSPCCCAVPSWPLRSARSCCVAWIVACAEPCCRSSFLPRTTRNSYGFLDRGKTLHGADFQRPGQCGGNGPQHQRVGYVQRRSMGLQVIVDPAVENRGFHRRAPQLWQCFHPAVQVKRVAGIVPSA